MVYLDLDELERGDLECWPVFSSRTRWAMAHFGHDGHLKGRQVGRSLAEGIRALVTEQVGVDCHGGPVRLLTNLTFAGVVFNPVSFYYVFDRDEDKVLAVVEEVNNIPWLQQHCYVMVPQEDGKGVTSKEGNEPGTKRLVDFGWEAKTFHVSPFIGREGMRYNWAFSTPAQNGILVAGKMVEHDKPFFHATLNLSKRVSWSAMHLLWMMLYYPLMTVKVVAAILWEASKIWLKGWRFYPNPNETEKNGFTKVIEKVAFGFKKLERCLFRFRASK
mmetsp:Transcript_6673/g.13572  ORF Transcript_6673/g.13572 Transcript_6673/m.13572 type:complete len:274 (-) Transcript_6673:507-1328(-)